MSISGPPPFFYLKLYQIILLLSFLIGKLYCYTGVHNQISCWPARFLTPLVRYWSLQCLKYWLAYFECIVRVGVCIARDACSQLEDSLQESFSPSTTCDLPQSSGLATNDFNPLNHYSLKPPFGGLRNYICKTWRDKQPKHSWILLFMTRNNVHAECDTIMLESQLMFRGRGRGHLFSHFKFWILLF